MINVISIDFCILLQMLDLMFFMVILLVFIVAFGVASQAILYPTRSWILNLSGAF